MKSKAEELAEEYLKYKEIPRGITYYQWSKNVFLAGYAARDEEVKELQARLDEAVKLLEWYADYKRHEAIMKWITLPIGQIKNITSEYEEDAGKRARQFLKELKGEK